jgi:hypothetical protein
MKVKEIATFKKVYFEALEETFEVFHGVYLDEGISFFDTPV